MLQIDPGERRWKIAEIGCRRADDARQLSETPMGGAPGMKLLSPLPPSLARRLNGRDRPGGAIRIRSSALCHTERPFFQTVVKPPPAGCGGEGRRSKFFANRTQRRSPKTPALGSPLAPHRVRFHPILPRDRSFRPQRWSARRQCRSRPLLSRTGEQGPWRANAECLARRQHGSPTDVFAGIWTPWKGVRKVNDGVLEFKLFGFLTTEPDDAVTRIHEKPCRRS